MSPMMCAHLVPPAQTCIHIRQYISHANTRECGAAAVRGASQEAVHTTPPIRPSSHLPPRDASTSWVLEGM